jgi:negative regulator of flagellin synthesis FlgM
MEISGKVPPLSKTPYVQSSAKPVKKTETAPVAKGDRVILSAEARELQAAREALAKMDAVDHQKVARIKAQIAAGTYKVDAAKIADKMIEESLLDDLGSTEK